MIYNISYKYNLYVNFMLKLFKAGIKTLKKNLKRKNGNNKWGIVWYFLDPLMLFITFLFLFKVILKVQEDIYPLHLLTGLIIFNFFRSTTIQSLHTVNNNKKRNDFDLGISVLANLFHSTFLHIFEIGLLIILLIYFKFTLVWLLVYPIIFLFFLLFTFGVTLVLSIFVLYFRDLPRAWSILMRTLWFITPTFYFVEKTSNIYFFNLFNPLFYFLHISREFVIYNRIPELWMILVMIYGSLFTFLFGIIIFQKSRKRVEKKLEGL